MRIMHFKKIREKYLNLWIYLGEARPDKFNYMLLSYFAYIYILILSVIITKPKINFYKSMKNTAKSFYSLRVYKNLPTSAILNLMLCNRLMKNKSLVANAANLYKYSRRVFGSGITNFMLNRTFCRALTAGNTLEEAEAVSEQFRKNGKKYLI